MCSTPRHSHFNYFYVFFFRENDITGVLDHTFCVEHNAYGEIIQHELKPNGKSIPVTEENKKEYVRYFKSLLVNGVLSRENCYKLIRYI